MNQSKNAIGNLINRYRAVLKKCHLLNTFGSLAVVGMLVMGSGALAVGMAPGLVYGASAGPLSSATGQVSDSEYEGGSTLENTNGTVIIGAVTGTTPSIIGSNTNLVITGLGPSTPNLLSGGDITIESTGLPSTLTLGSALGSGNKDFNGNLTVNGENSTLSVKYASVNMAPDKSLSVLGGNLNIGGFTTGANHDTGNLSTTTLSLINSNVTINQGTLTTENILLNTDRPDNYNTISIGGVVGGDPAVLNVIGGADFSDYSFTTQSGIDQNTVILGSGGTLQVGGDLTLGGELTLGANPNQDLRGNIEANGNVLLNRATTLKSGDIYLNGTVGEHTLKRADGFSEQSLIIDGADTSLTVRSGGTWNADTNLTVNNGSIVVQGNLTMGGINLSGLNDGAIIVNNGILSVEHGATLTINTDNVGDDLTLGANGILKVAGADTANAKDAGILNIQGSTVTANLSDFGTVTITQDGILNDFEKNSTVQGTVNADVNTTLTLTGGEGGIFASGTVNGLKAEIATDVFGSDTHADSIILTGYKDINEASLSDVNSHVNLPTENIGAGTLSYAGVDPNTGAIVPTTVAGIVPYTKPGSATPQYASILDGEGVSLVLTGQNETSPGVPNGVLSDGKITVQNGATLTLGSDGGAQDTSIGNVGNYKDIVATGAGAEGSRSSVTIQNTNLTGNNFTISDDASLNITDASLTAKSLSVTDATVNVGSKDSLHASALTTNGDAGITLTTNAPGAGMPDTTRATLNAYDSVTANNISLDNASMNVDLANEMQNVSVGNNVTLMNASDLTVNGGKVNVQNTLTLTDSTLKVNEGSVGIAHLTMEGNSHVNVADGASTDGAPLAGLYIYNSTDFGNTIFTTEGPQIGQNTVYVGKGAILDVNGTFSHAGSADAENPATLHMGEGATLSATGLNLGNGITLTGGDIVLRSDGTGDQRITGTLTINDTGSMSSLNITDGIWTNNDTITVQNGLLILQENAVLNAGAAITIASNVDAGNIGSLILEQNSALNMGNNQLTANLADFVQLKVNDAGQLTGEFDASTATVYNILGTISTTNSTGTVDLNLVASDAGMLYKDELTQLQKDLKERYNDGDASDGEILGTINLANITTYRTLEDLKGTAQEASFVAGAGVYDNEHGDYVLAGIDPADRAGTIVDSTLVNGTLSLTGYNNALSEGSIDVQGGTLNLGYDSTKAAGTEATQGGTVKGSLTVGMGDMSPTGASPVVNIYSQAPTEEIQNPAVNIMGSVLVKAEGTINVEEGANLTIAGETLEGQKPVTLGGTDLAGLVVRGNMNVMQGATANVTGAGGTMVGYESGDAANLTINGAMTTNTLAINEGGTVTVAGDPTPTTGYVASLDATQNVTINGNGVLDVQAGGALTTQYIDVKTPQGYTFENDGTITLSGNPAENTVLFNGETFDNAGTLNLGTAGATNTAHFNAALNTSGTTNVLSGVNFAGITTVVDSGALIVDAAGATVTTNGLTVNEGGNLTVLAGTLDTTAGTLSVVGGDSTTFSVGSETGEGPGATLVAKGSDFGTITENGDFTANGSVSDQVNLKDDGTLALEVEFDSMSKAASAQLDAELRNENALFGRVTGTGDIDLVTTNGTDVELTGLYSLTYVPQYEKLDEAIMAGDLGQDGRNYNVSATGIVINTDEADPEMAISSRIATGSTLTLTGAGNADLLDQGSLANAGMLTLGVTNAEYTADFNGALTTNAGGTTNMLSGVNIAGATIVENGGKLVVDAAGAAGPAGTAEVTHATVSTAGLTVNEGGSLTVTAGTLDTTQGVFNVASNATVTVGTTPATAGEVALNATLITNDENLGIFGYDNAGATGEFIADGNIDSQLTLNASGDLILTGFEFDTMTKNVHAQLVTSLKSAGLVQGSGEIIFDGVSIEGGLYSLSSVPSGLELEENIMAGDLAGDVAGGKIVSFQGIVANDTDPNNVHNTSSIDSTSSLTLTGNNVDRVLVTADGTLSNQGELHLGKMDADYISEFHGTLTNAGQTNVLSNVNFNNTLNVTGGTLNNFANAITTKDVDINSGGTMTMNNGTWTAQADSTVKIEQGSININSGMVDLREAAFTAGTGATLTSQVGTELKVDIATIGVNESGQIIEITGGGSSATVAGVSTGDFDGTLTIDGFATTTFDLSDDTAGGALESYIALSNAANAAYGKGLDLVFDDVSLTNTESITLDTVADNDMYGFRNATVSIGDGTIAPGQVAVVGAIAGGDANTVLTNNGGQLTITGDVPEGQNDGWLYRGTIANKQDPTNPTLPVLTLGNGKIGGIENGVAGGVVNITGFTDVVGTTTMTAGTLTVAPQGSLRTADFVGDNGATVYAGANTIGGQSYLSVTNSITLDANGDGDVASLFIDPAWGDDGSGRTVEYQASSVALQSFKAGIDGNLLVGQNSQLALGTADTRWLADHVSASNGKVTWGQNNVTAALGIASPQTLATTGSLYVDGAATNWDETAKTLGYFDNTGAAQVLHPVTPNTALFADNSLLVVDATGVGSTAALSSTGGTLSVADSAQLHIVNGRAGQTVTVTEGFTNSSTTVATGAWGGGASGSGTAVPVDPSSITLSSSLIAAESVSWDVASGIYKVTLTSGYAPGEKNPYESFASGSTAALINNLPAYMDTNSPHAGLMLVSRALTESVYEMGTTNPKRAVATIEGAAQLGAVGNVNKNAMDAANTMASAVWSRNSLTGMNTSATQVSGYNMNRGQVRPIGGGAAGGMGGGTTLPPRMSEGTTVWAMPLYKWNSGTGYEAGKMEHGYQNSMGGLAVGADYTYALDRYSAIRYGMALNVGAGVSESNGSFNTTTNGYDFWGITAYGAYQNENFVGSFDMGLTSMSSKIQQDLPGSMGMGNLDTSVSSMVFTAGLNLEYTFVTEAVNITPHAGIRYMNVTTYDYDINSSVGLVGSSSQEDQGVWYFPVGVTLSKDFATGNGWVFTPKLDLGFVAAAGNLETNTSTSLTGVDQGLSYQLKNVDGFAFNGGLGFELYNKRNGVSFGLNYNIQASEHDTGHMIFANLRYEF